MSTRQPPRFSGVETYADRMGRFNFRFPTTWERFDIEGREGALFAPNPQDMDTHIAAWVIELEHPVVAEDLETLHDGVAEGIAQLSDAQVEEANDNVYGNLVKFERVLTFRQGENRIKRKFWLHYVDKWLMSLTWQGSSPDEYEYWLAMANYSFATFNIPNELWFNVDPDLAEYRRSREEAAQEQAGEMAETKRPGD